VTCEDPSLTSITERLSRAGLDSADRIAGLALLSIELTAFRTTMDELPIGASRFGGSPDLPYDCEWPTAEGVPLSFLAQVDLSQLPPSELPASGWLLLFYDTDREPWGSNPGDSRGFRVILVECSAGPLQRRIQPNSDTTQAVFEPCTLSLRPRLELPHQWDQILADHFCEIPKRLWVAYGEVAASISGEVDETPQHHLLGHPQLVQDDMRRQCQIVTSGILESSEPDPRSHRDGGAIARHCQPRRENDCSSLRYVGNLSHTGQNP